MATTVGLGNNNILIVRIPAKGAVDWASDFKKEFATKIVDHDHSTGKGARIKNNALVTTDMVGNSYETEAGVTVTYTANDVSVSTNTIQDAAVTTSKIADDAINGNKIADNSITSAHIAPDVVIDADIAPDSVGTSELKIDAVETENIKDDNVTTDKIADANITTAKIADANVTTAKISDLNVTTAKIADLNVTTAKIEDLGVTEDKLATNSVGSDKLKSGNILPGHLSTTGSNPVVLSSLANVSSATPSVNEVLSWSGTTWTPASLSGATGVVDTIASATDAANYSGTAQFIYITSSADVTFTNKSFVNRIIFSQLDIDITFEGCNLWRSSLKFQGSGTSSTNTVTFKNSSTQPIALQECDILIGNDALIQDNDPSSTQAYVNNCRIQVEGDLEISPSGSHLELNNCNINSYKLFEDSGSAYSLSVGNGTSVTCRHLQGNIACVGGSINVSRGIPSGGNTIIQGITGYELYNSNSAYDQSMVITPHAIDTNVAVSVEPAGTTANASSTPSIIPLNTEVIDNTSAFNTSTYKFTAKVAGYYKISYLSYFTNASTNSMQVYIFKNNAQHSLTFLSEAAGDPTLRVGTIHDILLLNIGDTVDIRGFRNGNSYGIPSNNKLTIEKING